jgi:predicted  nucleic acid-binding Zn-ribbon protein
MALSNCTQCTKLFQNVMGRSLCPECYGQRVFGRKPDESEPEVEETEPVLATRLIGAEHALRCEVRAEEGRAHRGSFRWGQAKFW